MNETKDVPITVRQLISAEVYAKMTDEDKADLQQHVSHAALMAVIAWLGDHPELLP